MKLPSGRILQPGSKPRTKPKLTPFYKEDTIETKFEPLEKKPNSENAADPIKKKTEKDKKGLPADLRSGIPTGTANQIDKSIDAISVDEGWEKCKSGPPRGSTDSVASLLNVFGDEERKIVVDEESSKLLDEFLAAGWIHVSGDFKRKPFYRAKTGRRENIPIRIRLKDFSLSKHQRRVLKKNADVQIEINPLVMTTEEAELFHRHKSRFYVTPPKSIFEVIPLQSLTEIKKVTVHEDDLLIAVSYLDVGKTSTYSMYAMFEPTIEWRSLGILSILKEIEFSISEGKEFYYLGFVYDSPSPYDYKKHFRGVELFDWNGNWTKTSPGGT